MTDHEAELAEYEDMIPDTPEPAAPITEAGVSLNWNMTDPAGANVQVTMRAAYAHDWNRVLGSRTAFLAHATGQGWKFGAATPPSAPQGVSPAVHVQTPASAPKPAGAVPAASAPKPAAAPTGPIAAATGKEILSMAVNKMVVEPRPDGKVGLQFFMPGHKFPDIRYVGKVEHALALLAPNGEWTDEHLAAANEYPVSMTIRYTLGKMNSAGTAPYKDILNVA